MSSSVTSNDPLIGTFVLEKDGRPIDDLLSMEDQLHHAQEALESLNTVVNAAEKFWLTQLVGRLVSFKGKLGLQVLCVPKKSPGLDLRDGADDENSSIQETFNRECDAWRTFLVRAYKNQIISVSRVPVKATAGTRYVIDNESHQAKPLLWSVDRATTEPTLFSKGIATAIQGLHEFDIDGGQDERIYRSGVPTTVRGLPNLSKGGFTMTLVDAPREFLNRKLFLAAVDLDEEHFMHLALCAKRRTLATLVVHISVAEGKRRILAGSIANMD